MNCVCVCLKDKEEADFVEWLKGQAELDGPEEVKDMVSVSEMCRSVRKHVGKIILEACV